MANLIRTERTYATIENATKALSKMLATGGLQLLNERYLIAAAPDGRFAPVLVGQKYIPFIHVGITVVG